MNRASLATSVALLACLGVARLPAQDSRIADRFPAAVAARITAVVDSATHDGLPADPLVLRALEGQAKSATAEQIVAAITRLRDVLLSARTTLGLTASPIELTTAAAALQAGMPQTRLAELHRLRGTLPVTAPLNAYLDLTARGTPADRAWDQISDLARKRAGDGEFVRLAPPNNGHDAVVAGPAMSASGRGVAMKSILIGALALGGVVTAAPGQAQLQLDTGGGAARLDQLPASSLTALGGGFDALLGHAHLQFFGTADDHTGLGVAGVVGGALSYRMTPAGWRIEAGPISEGARGIGEQWTSVFGGDVNAERDFGAITMHLGWQQGVANTGAQQAAWHRPVIGTTVQMGPVEVGASWQATFVQDSVLRDEVFLSPGELRTDTLFQSEVRDIEDFGVHMAWNTGPLALDGRVGRRWGANITAQTWWESHAALKITPVMSLTLRTGHVASDALLSLRGGQYTTLGLRLDMFRHPVRREHGAATLRSLEVVRASATTVHLLFVLPPGTRQVSITSDLTDWRPVALDRTDDGRWQVELTARPGVYRVNMSTDNGPWRVPPGLPTTDDGFGTKVGLLVLER